MVSPGAPTLEGFGCKLSPFGTYDTQENCSQDTNCSARYRCAKDVILVDGVRGENDVFGTFHPLGQPLIASDGVFSTPEECQCYTCDPAGGGCGPTTDGSNGTHSESTCGNACVYGYAANPATGICELSLDAVGISEEQCRVQEFQKNPAGGPYGGQYGCFSNFACRYGACVGIPQDGLDGPRNGEVVYDSMEACENSGCTATSVTVPRASVCLGSGDESCLYPNTLNCDPLPGTWQYWRVGSWRENPLYSATVTPNAHIQWKNPVVGAYRNWPNPNGTQILRIPSRPVNQNVLFPEFSEPAFREQERIWYDSVEMYSGPQTSIDGITYPAGYERYPNISIGFRRLDFDTVEVVILPASFTNPYNPDDDVPRVDADGVPTVAGRNQGWAYMTIHAPADQCFVMPSLDFEAEFPAVINMRLSPLDANVSAQPLASACVFGSLNESGGCTCDSYATGEACEYTCGTHGAPVLPPAVDEDGYPVC
jgi:hypothetical protein